MWRDVEVVWVGDVVSLFFARAFVWGDVDTHVGGLGAGRANLKCEEIGASPLILPHKSFLCPVPNDRNSVFATVYHLPSPRGSNNDHPSLVRPRSCHLHK
jgi:hypothetical protein